MSRRCGCPCPGSYSCKVRCAESQAVRVNPPVVPPANPPNAFSRISIDVTNNRLITAGFQGVNAPPAPILEPTIERRVRKTYADIFLAAGYYGSRPQDALKLLVLVNPDSARMLAEFPGTTYEERFVIIRNLANRVQGEYFTNQGLNPPSRTFAAVVYLVLDGDFEVEAEFVIPRAAAVCTVRGLDEPANAPRPEIICTPKSK